MQENTRKPRNTETPGDRAKRLEGADLERRDEAAANEERIDEMVRQNVERHGG